MCNDISPRSGSGSSEPEPSPATSDGGYDRFDQAMPIAPPPGLESPNHEHSSSGSEPECEHGTQEISKEPDVDPEIKRARDVAAAGGGLSGLMTVMVRYIPSKYTQGKLMNELNSAGFEGTYDFFYLPPDTRNWGNRGFAFINFLSAESAKAFYSKYHGHKLKNFETTTPIAVLPADVQGFDESARRFYDTNLRKKKNQGEPVFLRPVNLNVVEEGQRKGTVQKQKNKSLKSVKSAHHVPFQMEVPYVSPIMDGTLGLPPMPSTLPPRFCGTCGSARAVGHHQFCQYCGNFLNF